MALFFFLYFGHKAVGSRFHIQKEPPWKAENKIYPFPIMYQLDYFYSVIWSEMYKTLNYEAHIFSNYTYITDQPANKLMSRL